MNNQINEYTDEAISFEYIGVVFQYRFPPIDTIQVMNPLKYNKDYKFICMVKGPEGCLELLQVNNTDYNKEIINKISNIYRKFFIDSKKITNIQDLESKYKIVLEKFSNIEESEEYLRLQEELYHDFTMGALS